MAHVYEVIFMTDEAYYSVGWFSVKEEADQVAAVGNAGLADHIYDFDDWFMPDLDEDEDEDDET